MIRYRSSRNVDPPALVEVWNEVFPGRGAVRLLNPTWMEYFLFSKPFFDPESLIIALADQQVIGFIWTGFGPNDSESALDPASGVVCLLGVVPSYRRQGIGAELLHRGEAYLAAHGSRDLFAGPMYPLNPYTFGLYGGSYSPGFLDSDPLARPFFEHHGYVLQNNCLIFQRTLKEAPNIADGRFAAHRLRYEIRSGPFQGTTWWQECILGPVELHEYRLQDKLTGRTAARVLMWEMETYTQRWNEHAIGITDIMVPLEMRRQGLAKFLMAQMLRFLQDQFFSVVEMQVNADNASCINLLQSLGFKQVDVGHIYRKANGRKSSEE